MSAAKGVEVADDSVACSHGKNSLKNTNAHAPAT